MGERQATIRQWYLQQAALLLTSSDPEDRAMGAKVEAFVRAMPQPDSQRLVLARELRATARSADRQEPPAQGHERERSR